MMSKISVVIQTYNAEKHLERVLESVKGFDEIVLCDMESTDRTTDIAREYGCRIVEFEKKGYTIVEPYRNTAIHMATHDWVLVVDADELVTDELKNYLYEHIAKKDCAEGLYIPRKNFFMGEFMNSLYPDYILRFFKKEQTNWPKQIHSMPKIEGRTEKIPKKKTELAFIHLANDSVKDMVRKTNNYTDHEVERKRNRGTSIIAFFIRPMFRFIKSYIIKGGIADGKPGLIRAMNEAYYQMVLLAKIEEKKRELKK